MDCDQLLGNPGPKNADIWYKNTVYSLFGQQKVSDMVESKSVKSSGNNAKLNTKSEKLLQPNDFSD